MQKTVQEKIIDIITIALKNTAYAGLALSQDALDVVRYLQETESKTQVLLEQLKALQAEVDALKALEQNIGK